MSDDNEQIVVLFDSDRGASPAKVRSRITIEKIKIAPETQAKSSAASSQSSRRDSVASPAKSNGAATCLLNDGIKINLGKYTIVIQKNYPESEDENDNDEDDNTDSRKKTRASKSTEIPIQVIKAKSNTPPRKGPNSLKSNSKNTEPSSTRKLPVRAAHDTNYATRADMNPVVNLRERVNPICYTQPVYSAADLGIDSEPSKGSSRTSPLKSNTSPVKSRKEDQYDDSEEEEEVVEIPDEVPVTSKTARSTKKTARPLRRSVSKCNYEEGSVEEEENDESEYETGDDDDEDFGYNRKKSQASSKKTGKATATARTKRGRVVVSDEDSDESIETIKPKISRAAKPIQYLSEDDEAVYQVSDNSEQSVIAKPKKRANHAQSIDSLPDIDHPATSTRLTRTSGGRSSATAQQESPSSYPTRKKKTVFYGDFYEEEQESNLGDGREVQIIENLARSSLQTSSTTAGPAKPGRPAKPRTVSSPTKNRRESDSPPRTRQGRSSRLTRQSKGAPGGSDSSGDDNSQVRSSFMRKSSRQRVADNA